MVTKKLRTSSIPEHTQSNQPLLVFADLRTITFRFAMVCCLMILYFYIYLPWHGSHALRMQMKRVQEVEQYRSQHPINSSIDELTNQQNHTSE